MAIVEEKFKKMIGEKKMRKDRSHLSNIDYSAYTKGQEAGAKISINHGVKASTTGQKALK